MIIDEVVELDTGEVRFRATLSQEQTTAMVRWFITTMIKNGAVKLQEDNPEQEVVEKQENSNKGDLH